MTCRIVVLPPGKPGMTLIKVASTVFASCLKVLSAHAIRREYSFMHPLPLLELRCRMTSLRRGVVDTLMQYNVSSQGHQRHATLPHLEIYELTAIACTEMYSMKRIATVIAVLAVAAYSTVLPTHQQILGAVQAPEHEADVYKVQHEYVSVCAGSSHAIADSTIRLKKAEIIPTGKGLFSKGLV